jgi:CHAT domain-containing protein
VVLRRGLAAARAVADTASEAWFLNRIGMAARQLGELGDARRDLEAAHALRHGLVPPSDLWDTHNALGLVAWEQGRFRDAAAMHDTALAEARTARDRALVSKSAQNLALVQRELGNMADARAQIDTAVAAARDAGNARTLGTSLNNQGMLEIAWGHPAEALPLLAEARRQYASIDYRPGHLNALGQVASAYEALGDFGSAFAAADSAIALARALGMRQEEAGNLELLASIHRSAGEPRKALAVYQQAEAINRELGLPVERGTDLRETARIYLELGERAAARRRAEAAVQLHRETDAGAERLNDLLFLAELDGDSVPHLVEARELASRVGTASARAAVAVSAARLALAHGRPEQALRAIAAAQPAVADGNHDVRWEVDDIRAEAELALGRLEASAAAGGLALAAVEGAGLDLRDGAQRAAYVTRRSATYARQVDVLAQLGRLDEALATADAMRARALVPDSARGRVPAPLDVAALRAALREGEVLVEYMVAAERLDAFVVTRAGVVRVTRALSRDSLAARVRVARDLLARRSDRRDRADAVLGALHAMLLSPAGMNLLGVARRVIVVPHGPLAYLPFAALRDPATGRYLVQDVEVVTLPSAGILTRLPAVAPPSKAGLALAPLPDELPASRAEVEAVTALVPGTEARLGVAATEALVRGAAGELRLLHIASHGSMNAASPLSSRIDLGRGTGGGSDDGHLEAREAATLGLHGALVYLSGCETGLGPAWSTRYATGEDAATLAQAFLMGGASGVVGTLWRVDDAGAAAMARAFYARFGRGSPAAALAAAQRELLEGPSPADLRIWAGYVVAGR